MKRLGYLLAVALLGLAIALPARSHGERRTVADRVSGEAAEAVASAAASFRPDYVPPAPGSYRLPVIQRIGDHPLVEASGRATTLFGLKGRRFAVVAFIYMSCAEAGGCPLAQAVLLKLDRELATDPKLRSETMLVSVSFDPERDTPEHLFHVRDVYRPRADWHFATSPDPGALQRMLDDFGQPIAKLQREDGRWSGLYRHVLKVFLLDRENGVRNIYSTGLLDRDLVLNDLRTLLRETEPSAG